MIIVAGIGMFKSRGERKHTYRKASSSRSGNTFKHILKFCSLVILVESVKIYSKTRQRFQGSIQLDVSGAVDDGRSQVMFVDNQLVVGECLLHKPFTAFKSKSKAQTGEKPFGIF